MRRSSGLVPPLVYGDAGSKAEREGNVRECVSTVLRRRSAATANPKAVRQRATTRMCTSMELLPESPIALPESTLLGALGNDGDSMISGAAAASFPSSCSLVCSAFWDGERKGKHNQAMLQRLLHWRVASD